MLGDHTIDIVFKMDDDDHSGGPGSRGGEESH